ncbi:glycoside hydrolase [Streptomyces abyssalis]|uniref:Glycoside hydrolase n=1 Tax=Streptomyces abyssalis TaxID=933944 RepID=A0A1E7JFB8_9ACTN|nr:C40 family peptidase [Streptomyces abyssalis]OEU85169.1 glycoside hydrolase [Streptomyces abyssalis]OEU95590.1 glycoside hydrolase [Streptomyces abyssalis]OEV29563.1 glycoside hydrolase [Streptomyces nanshensis]
MSRNAHVPRHRKPRSSNVNKALRAGATGGVLGAVALTTAISPASSAAEKQDEAAETVEMATVSNSVEESTTQAADSLKTNALQRQVTQAEAKATENAQNSADKAKKKAEAAERKAEAARKQAAESRASRTTERTALPSGSGNVAGMISFLKAQVGKSYVMGASGPSSYDCSGLTQAAFKQLGVSLPRTSQAQSTEGTPVSMDSLQPGDMLYWGGAGSAYHVGVYVGGGKFIGAQNSSTGVVEKSLDYDPPSGAVRLQ